MEKTKSTKKQEAETVETNRKQNKALINIIIAVCASKQSELLNEHSTYGTQEELHVLFEQSWVVAVARVVVQMRHGLS